MSKEIETSEQHVPTILECVQALSSVCDGAVTRDGAGFSAVHTHTGKHLSALPHEEWPRGAEAYLYSKILPVYVNQLSAHGLDLSLVEPPDGKEDSNFDSVGEFNNLLRYRLGREKREAKRAARQKAEAEKEIAEAERKLRENRISLDAEGEIFEIRFDYSAAKISGVRDIPGRKWDDAGKCWTAPVLYKEEVISFAQLHGLHIEDNARDVPYDSLRALLEKIKRTEAMYKMNKEESCISVHFPYSHVLLGGIRNLVPSSERRFNPVRKCWEVKITEKGMRGLLEFANLSDYYDSERKKVEEILEEIVNQRNDNELLSNATSAELPPEIKATFETLKGTLRPFQEIGVAHIINNKRVLVGDSMGCIDGEAEIKVHRAGKGLRIKLKDMYKRFHNVDANKKYSWDQSIPTKVRSLCNGEIRIHEIQDVLDKGVKRVVELRLRSGKKIKLTPDHEVCVGIENGTPVFVEAQNLEKGATVLTNGTPVCPLCESEDVVTYKYSKFLGYCKKCVYRKLRKNKTGKEPVRKGYRYICGGLLEHPNYRPCGIEEHRLVHEADINGYVLGDWLHIIKEGAFTSEHRFLDPKNHVHHINGIKLDNRPENLKSVSVSEHHIIHERHKNFPLFHPKKDKVVSVVEAGECHVYDIVCQDPHRNFVANGIIVHNCGKSIEAAAFIHTAKVLHEQGSSLTKVSSFPAVIIVPAVVKYNWAIEVLSWVPNASVSIVDKKKTPVSLTLKDGSVAEVPMNDFDADILIINYSIVKKHKDAILARKNNTVIMDESQMLKSEKSQRSRIVKEIATGLEYRVQLSGTAILNRPIELTSQLDIIDRMDDFGGFWSFARNFCDAERTSFGWNFKGASNLDELHETLRRSGIFLRRTKKQVMSELPDKQRTTIPMTLTPKIRKEYDVAVKRFLEWLEENAKVDKKFMVGLSGRPAQEKREAIKAYRSTKAACARKAEHLVKISYLKQLAVKAKMESIIDWVENFLESDEKLVLFGIHTDFIKQLAARFNAPIIIGETDHLERQKIVEKFQNDPECKLLIGNIQAAGVGITLTAASNVAFFELAWNNALHDQSEDRCYRYGQENAVNCWYLLAQDTIEERLSALIESKRVVTDAVLDGVSQGGEGHNPGAIGDLTAWLLAQDKKREKRIMKAQSEMEEILFDM